MATDTACLCKGNPGCSMLASEAIADSCAYSPYIPNLPSMCIYVCIYIYIRYIYIYIYTYLSLPLSPSLCLNYPPQETFAILINTPLIFHCAKVVPAEHCRKASGGRLSSPGPQFLWQLWMNNKQKLPPLKNLPARRNGLGLESRAPAYSHLPGRFVAGGH